MCWLSEPLDPPDVTEKMREEWRAIARESARLYGDLREMRELIAEIALARAERMRAALVRIKGINDNPAHYSPDIDIECDKALLGEKKD